MTKAKNKSAMESVKTPECMAMTYYLRQRRKSKGITMAELAVTLDVSPQFIAKTETNERRLDIYELKQFCKALDLNVIDVINYMDDENNQALAVDMDIRNKKIRKVYGKSNN